MKILADASLPGLEQAFNDCFSLTTYRNQAEIPLFLAGQDVLLCRSTLKVTADLIQNSSLQCIATASSGVDHIDIPYLNERNISLFDAKGSNAKAVADYVLATIAWLAQNKPIAGKKAGVIGAGYVGSEVANRLIALGFDVVCYDPYKDKEDTQYFYAPLKELFTCDLLCVHANLHNTPPYPSKNLIDEAFLSQLQPNTTIINASRGGIVNEVDLINTNKNITYCTDVYIDEPNTNPEMIHYATLCTPHIAGHSVEAKLAAVQQISNKLHQHFKLQKKSDHHAPPELNPNRSAPIALSSFLNDEHGQNHVLALYNPYHETQALKTAENQAEAFLKQRKRHYRHEFNLPHGVPKEG